MVVQQPGVGAAGVQLDPGAGWSGTGSRIRLGGYCDATVSRGRV